MNYCVNTSSLYENFPIHYQVPPLLHAFGDWLRGKEVGSVGYFSFQSDRFDDYWIENGADLHPNFAFFLRDSTGGQIGYWFYDGPATTTPPIVMVGSEGELAILSDTLEEFLLRLAEGNTKMDELDSLDQGDNERQELAHWLEHRIAKSAIKNGCPHPDLEKWVLEWGEAQRAWIDGDSIHLQIADKLRKFVKPNAEAWETANFDVLLVGTQFKMWHRSYGPKPMPKNELTDLEQLFRSAREQRAEKNRERGLWLTSWVKIGSQGGACLCCNFMEEPHIMDERPIVPISDYKRDLNAFPRSKHWLPKWLEDLA